MFRLKREKKWSSVLTIVVMLAALIVPFAGTASAACSYSLSSVPAVSAGVATPLTNDFLTVTLDNTSAQNLAGSQVVLELPTNPSGFGMLVDNATSTTTANISAYGAISSLNATVTPGNAGGAAGTFVSYTVYVNSVTTVSTSASDTTFSIPFESLYVPVGVFGSVSMVASAPFGSLFAPAYLPIATVGASGGGGGAYSLSYVPAVLAGVKTSFTPLLNVTMDNTSAQNLAGSQVVLELPTNPAGYGMLVDNATSTTTADIPATGAISSLNATVTPGNAGGAAGTFVSYTVYVNSVTTVSTSASDTTFSIPFESLYVPSGVSGNVTLTATPANGSLFVSASLYVAFAGTSVALASESAPSIPAGSDEQIGVIDITENLPGALLDNSGPALTLTLPSGVTWDAQTALLGPSPIWGAWSTNGMWQTSISNSGRELDITTTGGTPTSASYYESQLGVFDKLNGYVDIDQSVANLGDIVVTVGGASNYTPATLTVAKYSTYSISAEMLNTPTITAGVSGSTIGEFEVLEGLPGSLINNRTIDLTLPSNVVWSQFPQIDTSNSTLDGIGINWYSIGTAGNEIEGTITGYTIGSTPAVIVFNNAEVTTAADFSGPVTATLGGSEGLAGTLTLADVAVAINMPAIAGVTAPVTGATPVTTIAATSEYTAAISWSGSPATFANLTAYTATITITPKTGYTLTGVAANFFTVAGATATNAAGSGVVKAVFPATLFLVALTTTSTNVNVGTTPLQVTVSSDVNNPSLTTSPVNGTVTIPQINVVSSTSLGTVDVSIPAGTQVTGPSNWNGTIIPPQVVANSSVTVTPDSGYTASVSAAIYLGLDDTALTFSQPVRILIPGQGGKDAGWVRNGTFTKITYQMGSDSGVALGSNDDGYLTVGNDLVIWTKHFTTFVAYTETANSSNNGGGGGASAVYTPAVQTEAASTVTASSAVLNGSITSDNGYAVTDYGFLWGTSSSSLTNKLDVGTNNESGAFSDTLSGLTAGTTYYFQAYATNSYGTADGAVLSLTAVVQTPTTPTTPTGTVFSDVPPSFWGYNAISSLISKGIISGYPDGTFKPDAAITRAEFATMLVKALGLDNSGTNGTFTDVTSGDWYYNSVNTAVYAGLASGTGDNLFAPNALITREQMTVMVTRALGDKAFAVDGTELNFFSDKSAVSGWAVSGMEEAVGTGIVHGMGAGKLAPQADATRAQAAEMIYMLRNLLGK